MDAATFAALLPLFQRSRRGHLQGWGEPLLHPLFFDFAAQARQAGCRVSSTSCGLHIDEQTARAIVHSGMDILAFSLAGTDEQSNAVRQGAPFARVCESIARVRRVCREERAEHLQLHCAYILLADRMAAVLVLPELMARLGLDAAVVSTLDYVSVPEHAAWAFAPQEQEKIARARGLLQQAADRAGQLGLRFSYALPGPEPWGTCREEVEHSLYVDAEGALSPCIYLNVPTGEPDPHRRVFGKVRETDAFSCWQGKRFTAFRAALAGGTPEPPCIACAKRFEKTD
jgi:MoaA/NifB/PqqE/SkfB family radical SAM enzyme